MLLRMALVLTLLSAPFAAGCASDAEANGTLRAGNAQNQNPPTTGIGANGAGAAAAPRDMPGNGRGSLPTSHGK
jgi:hypothetical protein